MNEQSGIQAKLTAPQQAHPGDTLQIVVQLSWKQAPENWLVLPGTSPESVRLQQIRVETSQKHVLNNGSESGVMEIAYTLVAKDTGEAVIPDLHYTIPTTEGEQTVVVPSQSILITPNPAYGIWASALFALMVATIFAGVLRQRRRKRRKKQQIREITKRELARRLKNISLRTENADVRSWMQELEALVQDWHALMGATSMSESEEILFNKLAEVFQQSRYGGGPLDRWQAQEHLTSAKKLMQLQIEEDDNE